MCIVAIVDADSLSILTTRQGFSDKHFLGWIRRRHGVLAFSSSGRYYEEIRKNRAVMEILKRYQETGRLRVESLESLKQAETQLAGKSYRSNDVHILSLALVSEARVLCSQDENLRSDFKNAQVLPQSRQNPRLLYPFDSDSTTRRQFLNRQRCDQRQKRRTSF